MLCSNVHIITAFTTKVVPIPLFPKHYDPVHFSPAKGYSGPLPVVCRGRPVNIIGNLQVQGFCLR